MELEAALSALRGVVGQEEAVAALEARLAELNQSATSLGERATVAETTRAEAETARLAAEAQVTDISTQLLALKQTAAEKYRSAVVGSDEALGKLVKGATIEEIEASFVEVKTVIDAVRATSAAAAPAVVPGQNVPAGGGQRLAHDLASMSSREKIMAGVAEAGRKP